MRKWGPLMHEQFFQVRAVNSMLDASQLRMWAHALMADLNCVFVYHIVIHEYRGELYLYLVDSLMYMRYADPLPPHMVACSVCWSSNTHIYIHTYTHSHITASCIFTQLQSNGALTGLLFATRIYCVNHRGIGLSQNKSRVRAPSCVRGPSCVRPGST